VTRTLVVSAFEPEIAPLRRRLGGRRDVQTATVGIGAIEAAIGATRAIAATRPSRLIFVGTAGVYARGRAAIPIGGVAVAGEIQAVSTAALRGAGFLPAPVPLRADASAALAAALAAALPGAAPGPRSVACPLAITRTAALGRSIADATGADLENLELFAVARAALTAGVELGAVLGVANRVGPSGHHEWLEHHREVSRAACDLLWRFLSQPVRQRSGRTGSASG
jgi:nucleoside phosphorylase